MKTRRLTGDVEIPYLGFGTYLIPNDEVAEAVRQAIVAGYRHIDTAEAYQNESAVGAGIRRAVESEGLIRSELFVTTKLWPGNIEELKVAGLPLPAANQIELHPWSQKPELVRYLDDHAIVPIAYSSLVPLSTWRTAQGQDSAKTDRMRADGAPADAPFKVMAKKYGVTEAQILLRWAIQKGYPVLPKSTQPARMRKNADIFGFAIDDPDMAAIEKMDRGDGVAWAIGDPTKAP